MVASPHCLPIIIRTQCISRGETILVFTRKWKKRHGVLGRRNGFGLLGLLGFGWHEGRSRYEYPTTHRPLDTQESGPEDGVAADAIEADAGGGQLRQAA